MQQFRKLRAFPFSVFFIVGNEFCERFSYYGMRGKQQSHCRHSTHFIHHTQLHDGHNRHDKILFISLPLSVSLSLPLSLSHSLFLSPSLRLSLPPCSCPGSLSSWPALIQWEQLHRHLPCLCHALLPPPPPGGHHIRQLPGEILVKKIENLSYIYLPLVLKARNLYTCKWLCL